MSPFHTTQWSLVFAARSEDEHARMALAELCRRYREPVFAFIRCSGHGEADADDLTQAFFVHLLERRADVGADPARGRFRSYLLGALRHFLADARLAGAAAKRGGGRIHRSLDEAGSLTASGPDPERAFDRGFAIAGIDRAMQRLREEAEAAGKAEQLRLLQEHLLESRTHGALQELAARTGVRANTLAVAVKRWRSRLAALVRDEVARTVADPRQIDAEMRALRDALADR